MLDCLATRSLVLKAHLFLGLLATATMFGGGARAYDGTWYRADFWSGEYPAGFTLTADVSIQIRLEPVPDAPPTVRCDLSRNATYHPWNGARIADRKLKFVSRRSFATKSSAITRRL